MRLVLSFGKLWLIVMPFALLEGLFANESSREFATKFDGSSAMWIALIAYYLALRILFVWLNHERIN